MSVLATGWFEAEVWVGILGKSPGWFNPDVLDAVVRSGGAEPCGVWREVEPGRFKVQAFR